MFSHIDVMDLTFYDTVDPVLTRHIIDTNVVERSFPYGKNLKLYQGQVGEEYKVIKEVLNSSLLFQFSMHNDVPLQYWKYKIGYDLSFDLVDGPNKTSSIKNINTVNIIEGKFKIIVNPMYFYRYFLQWNQDKQLLPGYDGSSLDFWKDVKWYPCQVAFAICACFAPTLRFVYYLQNLLSHTEDGRLNLLGLHPDDQTMITTFTNKSHIASHLNGYHIKSDIS